VLDGGHLLFAPAAYLHDRLATAWVALSFRAFCNQVSLQLARAHAGFLAEGALPAAPVGAEGQAGLGPDLAGPLEDVLLVDLHAAMWALHWGHFCHRSLKVLHEGIPRCIVTVHYRNSKIQFLIHCVVINN
jgi:hypothetical protein